MKIRVPGDKSISQRALILSSLAEGESRVRGLLTGGDPASTASALRALGAEIPTTDHWDKEIRIRGLGLRGLSTPEAHLDLGNSGTGARLLLGVLAGQAIQAVVTGDESLRSRPMGRITDPLSSMGARYEALGEPGRLPIRVVGGALRPLEYRMPVASAQLKSDLLLAGLVGGVPVSLKEPSRSRDHTESMLRVEVVPVQSGPGSEVWKVSLPVHKTALHPLDLDVPGDISSAAFFLLLGLLRGGEEPLVLEGVGLNQTRTGILTVLQRMGAEIRLVNQRGEDSGEPMGDLVVLPSQLTGTTVGGSEIPLLIDEIPVLVVGALRARGETRITGAGELRVKETDRIRALVANLRALGVEAEELDDGLAIEGTGKPLSGSVESFGDHRIAMAFGILGALPGNSIQIRGEQVAGVSFPGFWELLEKLR